MQVRDVTSYEGHHGGVYRHGACVNRSLQCVIQRYVGNFITCTGQS